MSDSAPFSPAVIVIVKTVFAWIQSRASKHHSDCSGGFHSDGSRSPLDSLLDASTAINCGSVRSLASFSRWAVVPAAGSLWCLAADVQHPDG